MEALNELRPYNNWLYWLEYNNQVLQKESHEFLENDEECKVIFECDADETFMEIAEYLKCSLDFIEKPEQELKTYLTEINFNSKSHRITNYKQKIQSYIELFAKHRLEIQQINAFHQVFSSVVKLLNQDVSLKNKDSKVERLDNLMIMKSRLEQALKLNEKSYGSFLLLSYACLSIYQIKKDSNLLTEDDQELLDTVKNTLERIKATKEYNTNGNNAHSLVFYNQACLEFLKGNTKEGLIYLERSLKNNDKNSDAALELNDIKSDPDLKIIWDHPEFNQLCNLYFNSNELSVGS